MKATRRASLQADAEVSAERPLGRRAKSLAADTSLVLAGGNHTRARVHAHTLTYACTRPELRFFCLQ